MLTDCAHLLGFGARPTIFTQVVLDGLLAGEPGFADLYPVEYPSAEQATDVAGCQPAYLGSFGHAYELGSNLFGKLRFLYLVSHNDRLRATV